MTKGVRAPNSSITHGYVFYSIALLSTKEMIFDGNKEEEDLKGMKEGSEGETAFQEVLSVPLLLPTIASFRHDSKHDIGDRRGT